jgi:AcrR family transcriptional regulator
MAGTGLKQITKTADAPFGSLYHFFPGGKAQLAEEVIRTSGKTYFDLVMQFFDACPDLPAGIETAFKAAAELLVETDYADACPIATIALEVASTDETLRVATADVFADWIDAGARRLAGTGLPEASRRRLMIGIITSLEGAFILCRALRSTEPLEAASRTVLHAVRAELSEHFTGHAQPPG